MTDAVETVCVIRDGRSTCPNVKVCVPANPNHSPSLLLLHPSLPFTPSANLGRETFSSVKWCSAERRTNKRHLAARFSFRFKAFPTSAGWILLTQVSVSWTGTGALLRHNGPLPPPPPPPPHAHLPPETLRAGVSEWEGSNEKEKEELKHIINMPVLSVGVCVWGGIYTYTHMTV